MDYTEAKIGRVFVLKFTQAEDLLDEIRKFCKKAKLRAGVFTLLGGLASGAIVAGPKKPRIPPVPNWQKVDHAWEMLGIGTIFPENKNVSIHLHTALGQGAKARVGCLRKAGRVFIVTEAVVYELKNLKAQKRLDPQTGLKLLQLG